MTRSSRGNCRPGNEYARVTIDGAVCSGGDAEMRGPGMATSASTKSAKRLFRMLGPGLVTGAADDDPSGIATYSQGGAQFGYALGWTMFLTTPFMIAIQLVSARIGAVTGQGLAANLGKAMPRLVLHSLVGLLLIANTLNIAADIAAMGGALLLAVGGTVVLAVGLF